MNITKKTWGGVLQAQYLPTIQRKGASTNTCFHEKTSGRGSEAE